MDIGNRIDWHLEEVVPSAEIIQRINQEFPVAPISSNSVKGVADRYRYKDGQGEIGFISSISMPFCHDCGRARLSAAGKFYLCLFTHCGYDLRPLLHSGESDDNIAGTIKKIWQKRTDRYSEERAELIQNNIKRKKIEMHQIGG
jgi:cyclic pyranopterin phosphate synthase